MRPEAVTLVILRFCGGLLMSAARVRAMGHSPAGRVHEPQQVQSLDMIGMEPVAKTVAKIPHDEVVRLVRRARAGDAGAAEVLVQAYQPGLDRYLRSKLRTAPHIDLGDVSQDIWLNIFRKLHVYDEVHAFGQFLYGVAKNHIKRAFAGRQDLSLDSTDDGDRQLLAVIQQAAQAESRVPDDISVFRELLEITTKCGGHPHQVIAFSYSIVVHGQPKKESKPTKEPGREIRSKVPVVGKPSGVVKEYSNRTLQSLADWLVDFFAAGVEWDREGVLEACSPLMERLKLVVQELFAHDKTSSELFHRLLRKVVGHTLLADYYGKNPAKSIADWTKVVKDHVRRRLDGEGACERCVYPCDERPRELPPKPVDGLDGEVGDTDGSEAHP